MTPEFIRAAVEFGGMPLIKHIKTGGTYYIREIIETKVDGQWQAGVMYFGRAGRFVRLINDFQGFEYTINE